VRLVRQHWRPLLTTLTLLRSANAVTLYGLVGKNGLKNTQVVLTGITPGGEYKVASYRAPVALQAASLRWLAGLAPDPVMLRRVPAGTGAATSPRGPAAFSDACLAVPQIASAL
jgi:hypothetical protein